MEQSAWGFIHEICLYANMPVSEKQENEEFEHLSCYEMSYVFNRKCQLFHYVVVFNQCP